jgi:hypothetical protein
MLLACGALACSCSRSEAPAPVPSPVRTLAPVARAEVVPPPAGVEASPVAAPAPAGSPGTDAEEFEWNLDTEASGPDFEIDADATSYYMPLPNTVTFKAKALNGTPPFTFTWNFGDGSPTETGEVVKHTYTKLGRADAVVDGKDANGETSRVTLGLLVTTPESFVQRMDLDPKLVDNWRGGPSPGTTP